MTRPRKHGGWGAGVAAAAVVLAALASGCSGSGDDASSGSAGASSESLEASALDRAAPERQGLTGEEAPGRAVGSQATGRAGLPAVQTRAVIRKGEIWLVTEEMNRVRTEIDDLLGRLGGYVASEDSRNDRAGRPERAVLVLRVPEPAFADALEDLRRMARTEHVDRSSDDVTTQVIDVDTRVATQEASLARLRTFLKRATTVEDMIRVESEIATRQAELESLKAQQKYLHDQTAMST